MNYLINLFKKLFEKKQEEDKDLKSYLIGQHIKTTTMNKFK